MGFIPTDSRESNFFRVVLFGGNDSKVLKIKIIFGHFFQGNIVSELSTLEIDCNARHGKSFSETWMVPIQPLDLATSVTLPPLKSPIAFAAWHRPIVASCLDLISTNKTSLNSLLLPSFSEGCAFVSLGERAYAIGNKCEWFLKVCFSGVKDDELSLISVATTPYEQKSLSSPDIESKCDIDAVSLNVQSARVREVWLQVHTELLGHSSCNPYLSKVLQAFVKSALCLAAELKKL